MSGARRYGSNLAGVNLLGRKKDNPQAEADAASRRPDVADRPSRARITAPKGRPTPKRNEAAPPRSGGACADDGRRGQEARKELGGPKLSRKEERNADKVDAPRRRWPTAAKR